MRKILAFLLAFSIVPKSNSYQYVSPYYYFDGLTSAMVCGTNDALLAENGTYTICAEINAATVGEGGAGRIIDRGASATLGLAFSMVATATLQWIVTGSSDLTLQSSNSANTLLAWHTACLTTVGSATANTNHIYVDGAETTYKTTTNGATLGDNSAVATRIGNSSAGSRTMLGIMRNVQVWNVVLTIQQIKEAGKFPGTVLAGGNGLIAFWPLAGNGTSTEKNMVSNINTHDCTTMTNIQVSTTMAKQELRTYQFKQGPM